MYLYSYYFISSFRSYKMIKENIVFIGVFFFCLLLINQSLSTEISKRNKGRSNYTKCDTTYIEELILPLFMFVVEIVKTIWYSPVTNETKVNYEGNGSINIHGKQIPSAALKFMRVGFRSNGCTCQNLTCGCCFGMNVTQFNYDREGE